ncbi:MAG: lantibiotic biosynthesis protein, partial [Candidatus Eremiobacteraeota bacterium]|nr:lantibiotic biosynthesis protein [Candidatus Eremiobacteraeota bacterium]
MTRRSAAPAFRIPDDPFVYVRVPHHSLDELDAVFAADDPVALARELFRERPAFRTALSIASPVLFRELERDGGARIDRRAALRCIAYFVRMASRCTPFGTFATVSGVEIGPATTLSFDPGVLITRTRVDMAYVDDYAKDVEALQERRDDLEVVASESVFERGGRLHIVNARRSTPSRTAVGGMDYVAISVRNTGAVEFIRSFAGSPRTIRAIASAVGERFGIGEERGRRLVDA